MDIREQLKRELGQNTEAFVGLRRLVIGGNAGGLAATLGFLGTLIGESTLALDARWFFVPISGFLISLISSGFGQFTELRISELELTSAITSLEISEMEDTKEILLKMAKRPPQYPELLKLGELRNRLLGTGAAFLLASTVVALALLWVALTPCPPTA